MVAGISHFRRLAQSQLSNKHHFCAIVGVKKITTPFLFKETDIVEYFGNLAFIG